MFSKKITIIIKILENVITLALILVFFIVASPLLPFENVPRSYIVSTGSMEPTISAGSLVITEPVDPSNVAVGDIIAFISPNDSQATILHRVEAVNNEDGLTFSTKGDNNNAADAWQVDPQNIKGRKIFTIGYLGHAAAFLREPAGFIIAIVIPALLLIISQIFNIKKAITEEVEKRLDQSRLTSIIFIASAITLSLASPVIASYQDKVVVEGATFSVKDFVAPAQPAGLTIYKDGNNLGCNLTINSNITTLYWQPNPETDLAYYWLGNSANTHLLKVYPPDNQYLIDLSSLSSPYSFTLIAVDTAGNESPISSACSLTLDQDAPTAELSITGSWTKEISSKIVSEQIDNDTWQTAGDVEVLADGSVQIGSDTDPGNYAWENRLMQSFSASAKTLSLWYNFFTRDFAPFDDPGFFIRLNGDQIFYLNTGDANDDLGGGVYSTGQQQFLYDLSQYSDSSNLSLALYSGNTGDDENPSWTIVDEISTWFVAAPAHATYTITGSEPVSCHYKIDDGDWQTGDTFTIPDEGEHTLLYYCQDTAGNASATKQVTVITDDTAPADVIDLADDLAYENSILLSWTAPGNDGDLNRASKYDLRYQTCTDAGDFDWETATPAASLANPKHPGLEEQFEVLGLNQGTDYCFGLKTADEAPNWSGESNILFATTDTSLEPVAYQDIIINELMWMGSSVSPADEWLELRNLTDHEIDLQDFTLYDYNDLLILTIPAGKTIPPHGYFLISNYDGIDSSLKDVLTFDLVNPSLVLSNSNLQISLYDPDDNLIDTAWDGTAPTEGINETGKYYSMERTSTPGDGDNPLSWYTCIDPASTADFFDGASDERGTPGAQNRSENEPLAAQKLLPRLSLDINNNQAIFNLSNVSGFKQLTYSLGYDTATTTQAISGSETINTNNYASPSLYIGSCSDNVCTPHTDPRNFMLQVKLTDKNGNITNLSTSQ